MGELEYRLTPSLDKMKEVFLFPLLNGWRAGNWRLCIKAQHLCCRTGGRGLTCEHSPCSSVLGAWGHLSSSSYQLQKEPELFAWSHLQQREWLPDAEPPGLPESRGGSKGHANELCQAMRVSKYMSSLSSEDTAQLR